MSHVSACRHWTPTPPGCPPPFSSQLQTQIYNKLDVPVHRLDRRPTHERTEAVMHLCRDISPSPQLTLPATASPSPLPLPLPHTHIHTPLSSDIWAIIRYRLALIV
jgi:hypothetical protein